VHLTQREFFQVGVASANEWSRETYGKDFDAFRRPIAQQR
jgi:hypothetical protein